MFADLITGRGRGKGETATQPGGGKREEGQHTIVTTINSTSSGIARIAQGTEGVRALASLPSGNPPRYNLFTEAARKNWDIRTDT